MRSALPLFALLLASCGEPVGAPAGSGSGNETANSAGPLVSEARPVRVGELGSSFDACSAAGTVHRRVPDTTLEVRAAPFDTAAGTGSVPTGARFFVCTRTLDQKWFGIVYSDDGALSESCGVSAPLPRRRDYAGPCRSGWVQSAFVRLISGVDPAPANRPDAAPSPEAIPGAPAGG